jgi:UDP-N-acetyl-D-mannosaminuronic acid dehydrogenase
MINVIGQGYMGLPIALMFAKSEIRVAGTDCNEKLVWPSQKGKLNFGKRGLEKLFKKLSQIELNLLKTSNNRYLHHSGTNII